ncbi:MAG TPA: energy transducer TonB [Bryobacteraceae bacterium]|nr:energy transducer TonB [Bryobacteraceae bacterium]
MFEQSLLLDPSGARKTGALAISLTMQTAAVALLIALPLIYGDRLPIAPRFTSLPSPPPPLPPERPRTESHASTAQRNIVRLLYVAAPRHIVPLSEIPEISASDAPPAYTYSDSSGVPGGIGIATSAPQVLHEMFPTPKPPAVEAPKAPTKPVPIGGDVQAAKLIRKIVPVYPPLARQARVSGTVRLIGIIAKDGTIQQLQVVSGHPLLIAAAMDAVRRWIYKPTLLNGQAVEVIAPIDVIFTLGR